MKSWRDRTEIRFETLADWITARPLITLLLCVLFVGGIASNLPNIRLDTTTEGFLSKDDPAMKDYQESRDIFGRSEMILIAVKTPTVYSIEFLTKFNEFHQKLESSLPHLNSIDSLVNAQLTHSIDDNLMVEDLLESVPSSPEELEIFKNRVEKNPFYKNLLISPNATLATIAIKPQPKTEEEAAATSVNHTVSGKILDALQPIISEFRADNFQIYTAGSPVVVERLKTAMQTEMKTFLRLTLGVIALFLIFFFRRLSGVLFPMLTVILSLVSTVGLMAFFDVPIQLPTTILPSFLLSVAVGDSVHLLAIFYKRLDGGASKADALREAMGHSGLPILLTSLTTAAGLLSFAGAKIVPVANLGIFSAIGVMLACAYTVVFLPALLSLAPIKTKKRSGTDPNHSPMDTILDGFSNTAIAHPKLICTLSFLLMGLAIGGASQLNFSHNPLIWLPESFNIRQSTQVIDQEMGGSVTVDIVIDSGKENGIQDPDLLRALNELSNEFKDYQTESVSIGKVTGITDLVKEIHQALNNNDPQFYDIPDSQPLVAQEFLLFENSGGEDIESLVDFQFQRAKYTFIIPWIDTLLYRGLIDDIKNKYETRLKSMATVTVTGLLPIMGSTLNHVISATAQSYAIAFIVISLMMIFLLGSFRYGLLSMIPNLFPILSVMGLMWYLEIPLDMFTMLIASIAIGIAVDDTVHFMYNFKKEFEKSGDAADAIRKTLQSAGRAMFVTSLVLASGFFVFCFSEIYNLTNFGLLTGIAISLALVADFLLAPALMILVHNKPGPS